MPLVILRLGQPFTGNSKTVVMEKFGQVNYQKSYREYSRKLILDRVIRSANQKLHND